MINDPEDKDNSTADSAEAFLRSNKDSSHEIFDTKMRADPFNVVNIAITSLRSMGYPIRISEIEKKPEGNWATNEVNALNVYVDSEKTKGKIHKILDMADDYDVYSLLYEVERHYTEDVMNLVKGDFDNMSRQYLPVKVKMLQDPEMKPVIERCFMQAYERGENQRTEELRGRQSYDSQTQTQIHDLYDQLKEKGVRPIDQEAVRGMCTMVIEDILEKHPELKP